ncbi:cellulose binding domain-containing protein [Streptomyces blattellae]|uniref:cellulose binding domain-containing protein n=1 Tax=Streptomyces blattellae TaxID=2569855 RepID=UPI0012B85421|nr:cellulose binding domain-containing protein [Streptomyces blattellae]
MRRISRTWPIVAGTALTIVAAVGVAGVDQPRAWAASSATVNGSTSYQTIDGFGFSSAFGRADLISSLPAADQQTVLDLLYSPTTGAGNSILRLGISSTGSSIQPTDPGGPNATPRYVWNGDDDGQVWLAKKAQSYGVSRFYADAWSAPGYMKTNGTENNGGTLCGLSGASCASGDWRRAYADYLVQYAKFYGQEGIKINEIGFTNEPDWTTSYSSMRFTPAQAAEFSRVLGPVADAAGFRAVCCDAVGWEGQRGYSAAIQSDAEAARWVSVHTGHSYSSEPASPLASGGDPTWMSEWAPSTPTWNTSWDDGSTGSGFALAQKIHTALTGGNVSAYLYWYGVSSSNTAAFIQSDGTNYSVSKRLWAMGSYSRYIRPGATRIGASTSDGNLRLSAFRNTDGSVVVVALNAAGTATPVSYALQNTGVTTGTATPYLTGSSNSMTEQSPIAVGGGAFTATVPARSLATYVIRPGEVTSPPPTTPPPTTPPTGSGCRVTYATNAWNTGLTASITIANTGGAPVDGWSLGFTLPAGQRITAGWNATYSPTSGQVTARNASYNATIPAGGSVSIGFQADHTGDSGRPAAFTLNGTPCAVT